MMPVLLGRAHERFKPGAFTPSGLSEWQASHDFTLGAAEVLDCDVEILSWSLVWRISRANIGAACIIEPHFNFMPGMPEARGWFVLHWAASPESRRLAESIAAEMEHLPIPRYLDGICGCNEMKRWIGTPHEYSGAPRLALLADTNCPAVIVETCHASNALDAEWVDNRAHRIYAGRAIGKGIRQWLS